MYAWVGDRGRYLAQKVAELDRKGCVVRAILSGARKEVKRVLRRGGVQMRSADLDPTTTSRPGSTRPRGSTSPTRSGWRSTGPRPAPRTAACGPGRRTGRTSRWSTTRSRSRSPAPAPTAPTRSTSSAVGQPPLHPQALTRLGPGFESKTATAGCCRLPSQTRPACSRTPVAKWKPDASSVRSWTIAPMSSNAITRTVRFGFGCSRCGDAPRQPAQQHRARASVVPRPGRSARRW